MLQKLTFYKYCMSQHGLNNRLSSTLHSCHVRFCANLQTCVHLQPFKLSYLLVFTYFPSTFTHELHSDSFQNKVNLQNRINFQAIIILKSMFIYSFVFKHIFKISTNTNTYITSFAFP